MCCWTKWIGSLNVEVIASCAMPTMRMCMFAASRAGQRMMALLKRLYEKLHLSVNESKSVVASAFGRKFLGFAS